MTTLYDIGLEIQRIREAADNLSVKGSQNASYVVYIVNKCNDMIQAINQTMAEIDRIDAQQITPPDESSEGDIADIRTGMTDDTIIMEEEGEVEDGEPNSGTSS